MCIDLGIYVEPNMRQSPTNVCKKIPDANVRHDLWMNIKSYRDILSGPIHERNL